jgi:hypothetical protein
MLLDGNLTIYTQNYQNILVFDPVILCLDFSSEGMIRDAKIDLHGYF